MKTWYIVIIILFLTNVQAETQLRASRPDVSATASLIVSADNELIALLHQLVCDLKMNLGDCCSFLTSKLDAVQEDIVGRLESLTDIFDNLTDIDRIIQNIIFVVSIIDNINDGVIASLIDVIGSSGSAFDQITSLLDTDIDIDQTILSYVDHIDTQLDDTQSLLDQLVDQNCQSVQEEMLSQIAIISTSMDNVLQLADQVLQEKELIVSDVETLNTQFDQIESIVDILAADACSSNYDVISSSISALQEQEASCCDDLSSQIDAIRTDFDTRIDTIQNILNSIGTISLDASRVAQIVSVIDFVANNGLTLFVESSFDHISSEIDSLQACGAIPISAPGTISVSGNYCLTQNITGRILITASNVSLDLNGFTISNPLSLATVDIANGLQHVSVTGGRIIGSGISNNIGIAARGNNNDVRISHITIDAIDFGIYFFGTGTSTNIVVSDVTVTHALSSSYLFSACQGICSNCIARDSTGLSSAGFFVQNTNLFFMLKNTQAINVNTGYSFSAVSFDASNVIVAKGCMAYNNALNGFTTTSCNVSMYNCLSSYNGTYGFYIRNNTGGLIAESAAIGNTIGGFVLQTNSTTTIPVKFTGNYATDSRTASANGPPPEFGYEGTSRINAYDVNKSPFWWKWWTNTDNDKWKNAAGEFPPGHYD